jgi:putative acetyltransferase
MIKDFPPIVIRPEQPDDAAAIHSVHRSAFSSELEAELVDELRAAGRLTISLVAIEQNELIGHIAFSPVSLPGSTGGLGLAPVAVSPSRQRRGIGIALVKQGLAECSRRGFPFAVVLGDPNYYQRFGFLPAARWQLVDEFGGGDAFQAIELQIGGIPSVGGLVRYAPEFSIFTGNS